jgi:rhodanese-related sulfurtransferase
LEQQRQILMERLGLSEADLPGSLPGSATGGKTTSTEGSGVEGGEQRQVVLYCNGGVAACTAALALQRLGHRNWAVYDGSWNEWGARDDLPLETGGGQA